MYIFIHAVSLVRRESSATKTWPQTSAPNEARRCCTWNRKPCANMATVWSSKSKKKNTKKRNSTQIME